MKRISALALAFGLAASTASAVQFGTWSEQGFPRLPENHWMQSPTAVEVLSGASVSLIWTRLPEADGAATRASWSWSVFESVPKTQLDRKGGDDRNLALYFVFLPRDRVEASRNASLRRLLGAREARVLVYVWGGAYPRGEVLSSPYLGARGKTIVQRPAGTGNFVERIDLKRDFERAFGEMKPVLVGLAVSSDSDDTGSAVRARLGDLRLE